MSESLNAALLDAHASQDNTLISSAYLEAADAAEIDGDVERACFFLTHAWIYALEAGLPMAVTCHARLSALGRG